MIHFLKPSLKTRKRRIKNNTANVASSLKMFDQAVAVPFHLKMQPLIVSQKAAYFHPIKTADGKFNNWESKDISLVAEKLKK